jgi:hypothetical protein
MSSEALFIGHVRMPRSKTMLLSYAGQFRFKITMGHYPSRILLKKRF